jgi:hypothetical protein
MPDNQPDHAFIIDMAQARRSKLISEALEPLRKESRERTESTILLPLWQDLGDQTETYWQAMTAVSTFVEIERFIHEKLQGLDLPVMYRVAEALLATLQGRITSNRAFDAKRDEVTKANPLPGDNA